MSMIAVYVAYLTAAPIEPASRLRLLANRHD
jgi:hypothetical protein